MSWGEFFSILAGSVLLLGAGVWFGIYVAFYVMSRKIFDTIVKIVSRR